MLPNKINRSYDQNDDYRLRMLGCIVGAIVFLTGVIRFWPLPSAPEVAAFPYQVGGQELISLEEIQPTRQSRKPPPPPPPVIPLLVPDDIVVETVIEVEDAFLTLEEYGDEMDMADGESSRDASAAKAPHVGPKPLRLVEAEYTREAKKKKVRAEVVVQVVVNEKGRVEEAEVIERFLFSGNKNKKNVPRLDYGLEESALAAAERWTFRPARENGQPVSSYHKMTFRFGV